MARPIIPEDIQEALDDEDEVPEDPKKGNPAYMKWIRDQPCIGCDMLGRRQEKETQAHHIDKASYIDKCPDLWTVPLCEDCHILSGIHRGELTFLKSLGMGPRGLHESALAYIAFYFRADMPDYKRVDKRQLAWAYSRLVQLLENFEDDG